MKEIVKKKTKKYTKMKRAKGLIMVSKLLTLSSQLKMGSATDWVDVFLEESDEKIVLVCHHVNVVLMLMKRYKGQCLSIYGGVKVKDRKRVVRTFQTNPKYRIMVINKAGAEGITLTAANNIAIIEMYWTPGVLNQFIDRIHRIGQKKTVFVYFLVAKGTLEKRMCKILQKAAKTVNQILVLSDNDDEQTFDLYDKYIKSINEV